MQLLASTNLVNWKTLISFKKDMFPIDYFKYGVIAFPMGEQDLKSVYFFGEALTNLEGVINEIDLSRYVQ